MKRILSLLAILTASLSLQALMQSDEFSYAKSEAVSDQAEERYAEFEI